MVEQGQLVMGLCLLSFLDWSRLLGLLNSNLPLVINATLRKSRLYTSSN